MSGVAARAAFAGEEAGLVAGVSWLPIETLEALVDGTAAASAPESLEALVRALELDFAFVPAHEPWAAEAVARLHDAGAAAVWAVSGVLGRAGQSVGWSEVVTASRTLPPMPWFDPDGKSRGCAAVRRPVAFDPFLAASPAPTRAHA